MAHEEVLHYNTTIDSLGPTKIPTTIRNSSYVNEERPITLMMTAEEL